MLNCGKNIKSGEFFSGESLNITATSSTTSTSSIYNHNFSSFTCISKDVIQPLLFYDLSIMVSGSSSSTRRTSKNTVNKNQLRMYDYEMLNNLSDVSNNIMMIDISDDDDDNLERNSNNHDRNYLSATYVKGI